MDPKFNINRPKVSDEELNKHRDFDRLVKQFKEQSLKKAQGDESWWKNKKIQYATVIAGISVVCTVTYLALKLKPQSQNKTNETVITQKKTQLPSSAGSKAFIQPPLERLKKPYSVYKVNNAQGAIIQHSSGSRIKVPKNLFVDKNGRVINGDVTIEYREFRDAADIIASGIPMTYDSAATHYNFESAGMFDINGKQNGEPVQLARDKTLTVELASPTAEDRFNQYYLDTLKKNWQCLKHDKPTTSNGRAPETNAKPSAPVLKNERTERLEKQVHVILPKRMDSVKASYSKKVEKLGTVREPLKPNKLNKTRPTFVIEGSQQDFPELAAFENVVFEVGAENKNYTNELHSITWSDIKISEGPDKGRNYLLTLIYRQRREQLVVYPALSGADYEKAMNIYSTRLAEFEAKKQKRLQEEKKLLAEMEARHAALLAEQKRQTEELNKENEKLRIRYDMMAQRELAANFNSLSGQNKAIRVFEIAHFGIYNSDCAKTSPDGPEITPVFLNEGKPLRPQAVYFVDHSKNTVTSLQLQNGFKFTYKPGDVYSICVFERNRIFLCNKNDFSSTSAGSNKFNVSSLPGNEDNLPGLRKALEI